MTPMIIQISLFDFAILLANAFMLGLLGCFWIARWIYEERDRG